MWVVVMEDLLKLQKEDSDSSFQPTNVFPVVKHSNVQSLSFYRPTHPPASCSNPATNAPYSLNS